MGQRRRVNSRIVNNKNTVNQLRKSNIQKLPHKTFDVLIIGGGINGAVSAATLVANLPTVSTLVLK